MNRRKCWFLVAASLLAVVPTEATAYWNAPQFAQGLPWLQARALNRAGWIHFHGPLYNYGPYNYGYGYQQMFVPNPWCGTYYPAVPINNYMGGYSYPVQPACTSPGCGGNQGAPAAYPQGGGLAYPQGAASSPSDFFHQGQPTSPASVTPNNPSVSGRPMPIRRVSYYGDEPPAYFR